MERKKLGQIKLDHVGFGYNKKVIFRNVNLELKLPNIIAIQGANSSGRSTLTRLIAGIIKPTEGSITIDGFEAVSLTSENLVHHIGLLSSEYVMFQGTVMENLTAFDETKEDAALELVKSLNIDREIASLPKGYETRINNSFADAIAPGIKQRIAIVRVLLNKPKIILFNNADKGLDQEGYHHLIKLLTSLKGQITMIIITEDPNINKLADRHFLLKKEGLEEIKPKLQGNL